ncbi:MAG: hypothetical protein EOS52_19150 [Mesorhizobium sp.]|uniref:hypothetical protein n=1 Tax=Mesorhizobium sp. TaxID=1871066 RepID=UPI000FE5C910|nr:hypothetical protein [Mesorhizobium sp.]RWC12360.1 MAG: hypothetical protein EOS52_19150 [Mesorhizobium sp.]
MIQNILKSIRGQSKSVAELERALGQIDIPSLEAEAEKLEEERRGALLDGTDKDVELVERKIEVANREVERAYAAKTELEKRIEAAKIMATQQERSARYNAAKDHAATVGKALRKEYPELAKRLVNLIRAIAEADVAVEEANRQLPDDAAPLLPVEVTVRRRPGTAEKTISEKEVSLWTHVNSWTLFAEDRQAEADAREKEYASNYNGLPPDGVIHVGGHRVQKRRFVRRTYIPSSGAIPHSPLASIELPGLVGGDPPFWDQSRVGIHSPRSILVRLQELAALKPAPPAEAGQPVVELIPIADTPARTNDEPAIDMAEEP